VHRFVVALVAFLVAIRFLDDDGALDQKLLEYEAHVEFGILAVPHAQGDVLEIAEQREVSVAGRGRGFL
jgi:hypothetical protein